MVVQGSNPVQVSVLGPEGQRFLRSLQSLVDVSPPRRAGGPVSSTATSAPTSASPVECARLSSKCCAASRWSPTPAASTPSTLCACASAAASPLSSASPSASRATGPASGRPWRCRTSARSAPTWARSGRRTARLEQVLRTLQVGLGHGPVPQPFVDLGQLVLDHGEVEPVRRVDRSRCLLVGDGRVLVAPQPEEDVPGGPMGVAPDRTRGRAPTAGDRAPPGARTARTTPSPRSRTTGPIRHRAPPQPGGRPQRGRRAPSVGGVPPGEHVGRPAVQQPPPGQAHAFEAPGPEASRRERRSPPGRCPRPAARARRRPPPPRRPPPRRARWCGGAARGRPPTRARLPSRAAAGSRRGVVQPGRHEVPQLRGRRRAPLRTGERVLDHERGTATGALVCLPSSSPAGPSAERIAATSVAPSGRSTTVSGRSEPAIGAGASVRQVATTSTPDGGRRSR